MTKSTNHRQLQRLGSLFLVALLLVACSAGRQGVQDGEPLEAIRVLFVGNSYTLANELPDLFGQLARAGGRDVTVATAAQGGCTLDRHAKSEQTLERLDQQQWHYVVLQEQSVLPSRAEEREKSMYPAVRLLNAEIHSSGADAVLFMTWGRRDGLSSEGYPDFAAMQAGLEAGYMGIADELNLMVAPVGVAWQTAIIRDPQLDLWSGDGSHPSLAGSYLAACVLYAAVYQQSPAGLDYAAGLPEKMARSLQSIAAETVLEDAQRWNIP
jgi:hypothetical protein